MIQRMSHVMVYVKDQESAKTFYVDKLGFQLRDDQNMGPFRWLTVSPRGQRDLRIVLVAAVPSPMLAAEDVEALKRLQVKGALGANILITADCAAEYDELRGRGVEFTQPPSERPYGLEAMFQDDSGNRFAIVQER